jgi:hypothetical protein
MAEQRVKVEGKSQASTISTNNNSTSNPGSGSVTVTANNSSYRLPSSVTLEHAVKLGIVEDKPIMLDYWTSSVDKKALIGVRENNEKLLVKSAEEYTSPIAKFYKSVTEYIIITENSIYIVSADIPTRKIS